MCEHESFDRSLKSSGHTERSCGMGCTVSSQAGFDGVVDPKQRQLRKTIFQLEAENSQHRKSSKHLTKNLVNDEYHRSVYEVYEMDQEKVLGEGRFGKVIVAQHKVSRKKYAVKCINVAHAISESAMQEFLQEVGIHKTLDHPNIARLQEVYSTEATIFMVMDLCSGGDLLSRCELFAGPHRTYSENTARTIIRRVVSAARYCHDKGVTHRDLKLDNICYTDLGEDADVKVVDFGLSTLFEPNKLLHEKVGTCFYQAPEVIKGAYSNLCDMWSIGVITYMLLGGRPPFCAATNDGVRTRIKWGKFKFTSPFFDAVSDQAKDFISKLMQVSVSKRLTAEQALNHPWLAKEKSQEPLNPTVVVNLIRFRDLGKLHKLALEVVARSLEQNQISALKEEFGKLDPECRGEITRDAFVQAVIELPQSELGVTMSEKEAGSVFDELDINRAGSLPFNTYLAGALAYQQLDEAQIQLAFDRLDYNRKGFIAVDDLAMIVGDLMTESELLQALKDTHSDGDSTISKAKFFQLMVSHFKAVNLASITAPPPPPSLERVGSSDSATGPVRTNSKLSLLSMVQRASKLSLERMLMEEKNQHESNNTDAHLGHSESNHTDTHLGHDIAPNFDGLPTALDSSQFDGIEF